MSILTNTSWLARPEWDDYLNTISFGEDLGFAIYGDGQAIRWRSYFRYQLSEQTLTINFLPTAETNTGETYLVNESETEVQTSIEIGQVSYEASSRGETKSFSGKAITFDSPFQDCDEEALIYFEVGFNGISEKETGVRIVENLDEFPKPEMKTRFFPYHRLRGNDDV